MEAELELLLLLLPVLAARPEGASARMLSRAVTAEAIRGIMLCDVCRRRLMSWSCSCSWCRKHLRVDVDLHQLSEPAISGMLLMLRSPSQQTVTLLSTMIPEVLFFQLLLFHPNRDLFTVLPQSWAPFFHCDRVHLALLITKERSNSDPFTLARLLQSYSEGSEDSDGSIISRVWSVCRESGI